MKHTLHLFGALLLFLGTALQLNAQTTAFTYQGHLMDGTQPANGSYELQFRLADAATNGHYLGPTLTNAPVPVQNGLFTVVLDFGPGEFDGSPRWLEIGVRTNSQGTLTVLTPRQQITPTPYAIYAASATTASVLSGTLPASQLTGVLDGGSLQPNSVPVTALAPSSISLVTSNISLVRSAFAPAQKAVSGYSLVAQTANTNEVLVAPYYTLWPGNTATFGNPSGSSVEFLDVTRNATIRQNGTVSKAQVYLGNVSTVTSFIVKIWRFNGTTYDVVGKSADLHASLQSNATNTFTLNIPNVLFGDYVGVYCAWSGAGLTPFSTTNVANSYEAAQSYYITSGQATDSGFNWTNKTANASFPPVLLYENAAPVVAFVGDSLMGDNGTGVSPALTEKIVCETLGVTYNVLAKGGCGFYSGNWPYITNQLVAALSMRPKVVVLEGGIVDTIQHGNWITPSTLEPHWTWMFNLCQASNVPCIALKMFPTTLMNDGNSNNCAQMTAINSWLDGAAAAAGGFAIDVAPYVGMQAPYGPPGNLLDSQPGLTFDGLHYNFAGQTNLANAILSVLSPPTQPVGATMVSFPNGAGIYWSHGAPTFPSGNGSLALSDTGAVYVRTNNLWLPLSHQ